MGANCSCSPSATDPKEKAVGGDGCNDAVASELQTLLAEHPYLRPTGTEPYPHPLLYWVRRCRERLAAGQSLEAGLCLQRVVTALRREQGQQADAFRRFDVDSSGKLDAHEFKLMCAYIGWGEEEAKMMDLDHDSFVTLDEFQRFVGHMGGLQQLFERRRQRVSAKQWGTEARAIIETGSRVRAHFFLEDGRKSSAWREAQVLAVGVRGPGGITDGVLLAFFGADETAKARQVVPPSWIFSDAHDTAVVAALREVGILDDQQAFWASIFPQSEMRAVERLVPCQRKALANVRAIATELHESALPQVRERFTSLGLDESDLQSVLGWIQDLAPMVIHIHLDDVGRYLETDEFYRSQFETKTSNGAFDDDNQTRNDWEAELFGKAYEGAKPFDRCKYGALSVMNDFRGETTAYSYGDSYLVLKDVRLRATFTAEDSGGLEGSRLAVLDKYAHVLAEYSDHELRCLVDVAQANTSLVDPCRVQPQLLRGKVADPVIDWVTMGFPDMPQRRGRYFFEVRLLDGCRCPQVGLLSSKFVCSPGESSQVGVGDDEHGWAADGQHAMLWHRGRQLPWGGYWPSTSGKLQEEVIVGVAVDIDTRRLFFGSNGKWDENPAFGPDDLPRGLALYPALSLNGRAALNFGPDFKHPLPEWLKGFARWPGAPDGVVRVDTPMLGDSGIVGDYKEIQIHGEVNLKRNVQRLVANRKYRELTKQRRSYAINVSCSGGVCEGTYSRAGVRDGMPLYKTSGGASIYWDAKAQLWCMASAEEPERPCAIAPAEEGGQLEPPRQGWEVPCEFRGMIAVDAFRAALQSSGVQDQDCQRLIDALAGKDAEGQRVVWRSSKTASFEAEWEKLESPPTSADAAWELAVAEVQRRLLKEHEMPAAIVLDTEHPYEAKCHSWSREVHLEGTESLSVHFATMCATYDDCATFEIFAGGFLKAAAGVGARVQFLSFGGECDVQQMRGTVCERSQKNASKVQIDKGDLEHAEDYQDMMNDDIADYFVMCPDDHQSVTVKYTGDTKVADEISEFYLDREFPLTPFRLKGFAGPGPAQKQGVQAGWFLDICELLSGPSRDKFLELGGEEGSSAREDGDAEEPDPGERADGSGDSDQGDQARGKSGESGLGEPPDRLSEVCKDPEAVVRRLNALRDLSDVTLVFTNGLKTKLLPTANVTYPEGMTVGDEIEGFEEDEDTLTISGFKDAGPAQEAGVVAGWCLQRQQTMRQSKVGSKLLEDDLLSDPKALLTKSGITLVFEPPNVCAEPCFTGYCTGEEHWKSCKIPSSAATCTFRTDGDGAEAPKRRWGVFAVVLPHESSQPSQDAVDSLAKRWSEATTRAKGIRGSVVITPEDWDEARLRALCARHGWEFEWMTEDGERLRRIGDLQARRSAAHAGGLRANSVWWRLEAAATRLRGQLWRPTLKSNDKVEVLGPELVDQEGADPEMGEIDLSDLQLTSRPARELDSGASTDFLSEHPPKGRQQGRQQQQGRRQQQQQGRR